MRPKSMILILIALTCGLVASIGISQVVDKGDEVEQAPDVESGPVYVAAVDIPIGEALSAQSIRLEEWPLDRIPLGAVSKFEDIDGRRPKQPMYSGEPILAAKLIDPNDPYGKARQIPRGYRVVSVKVQIDTAAAGLILPGDRVDVLVFLKKNSEIDGTRVKTILTDVTVFAVDNKISRETTEEGNTLNARTISLLVKPDQVERLTLAAELGRIRLSLRRSDEDGHHQSEGVGVDGLDGTDHVSRPSSSSKAPPQDDNNRAFLGVMSEPVDTGAKHHMQIIDPNGPKTYTWDDRNSLPNELQYDESGESDTTSSPDGIPPGVLPPDAAPVRSEENARELDASRIILGPTSNQTIN